MKLENILVWLIGALAVWGACIQLALRSLVKQERLLAEGDEDRLAEQVLEVERALVAEYEKHRLEAWAMEQEESALEARPDPNQMDDEGEFAVPEAIRDDETELLLASLLLFPVMDDTWCEVKLSGSLPAGAYKLGMSGVLGRWGAYGAGGLPLLQVRVGGRWILLLGSPKRRSEALEAPAEFNFSVPHSFDGVRLKACTWQTTNSGGRLSLLRIGKTLSPPTLPPQKRSRFLVFELETGHANALLSLFNGVALAMLLNVSAVLPTFHTFFDEDGNRRTVNDPAAKVQMDYFYDVDVFVATVAPLVRVVRRLPVALEAFARDEEKVNLEFINPLLSSRELERLSSHFRSHNVLSLGSASRALVWNTPALSQLRVLLHSALRPSPRVAEHTKHVRQGMEAFAARKGLSPAFVGMQLLAGDEWAEYCRQEELNSPISQVNSWRTCTMDSAEVTQALEERQVGELSRVLYVASDMLNITQVQHLHHQRFVVMTKSRFTIEMQPDIGAAVDIQVCRESSLFVGNAYSSFSFLLRESKLVAGEGERAGYYNMELDATLTDLSDEEALRWDVMPYGIGGD